MHGPKTYLCADYGDTGTDVSVGGVIAIEGREGPSTHGPLENFCCPDAEGAPAPGVGWSAGWPFWRAEEEGVGA